MPLKFFLGEKMRLKFRRQLVSRKDRESVSFIHFIKLCSNPLGKVLEFSIFDDFVVAIKVLEE